MAADSKAVLFRVAEAFRVVALKARVVALKARAAAFKVAKAVAASTNP